MKIYDRIAQINFFCFLAIVALILWTYKLNPPVSFLFLPPSTPPTPIAGVFTHTFQILCSIPPIVCAFTFSLLKAMKAPQKSQVFVLASALVTAGFLANEVYRFHIILLFYNIPKFLTIAVYAGIFLLYLFTYFPKIKTTPYQVLLASLALLFVAITIDFLQIQNYELASVLEGIPKLLCGLNLALYFWLVCRLELGSFS